MEPKNELQHISTQRRRIIKQTLRLLGYSTTIALLPVKYKAFSQPKEDSKVSKVSTHRDYMKKAFKMKQAAIDTGDQAFGAIIVKQGAVVGLGPSKVRANIDPTAHAEIEAIRDACRNLKSTDLTGCVLYSTSKPCQMCESAGYWANLDRFYFGEDVIDGGTPRYSSC